MFVMIGAMVVISAVIGGYLGIGGELIVLWQPFEFLIIGGAGIGGFLISNSMTVVMGSLKSVGSVIKGSRYNKQSYLELLGLLYTLFKLAKTKGDLALESHIDNPDESSLFQGFPKFAKDHHSVEFLCDYLRLLTLGTTNSFEVEAIMDAELEVHHEEKHTISSAVVTLGDSFPALGIVAAVLGVIHTMGSITEPPEVLGHLIGGALVGTFIGILISYGFVSPLGHAMGAVFATEAKYLGCIKAGIIAHMQGYAPQVSIEFSRKTLQSQDRPTFIETENMIENLSPETG